MRSLSLVAAVGISTPPAAILRQAGAGILEPRSAVIAAVASTSKLSSTAMGVEQGRTFATTTSAFDGPAPQLPNRMTVAYNQMRQACPETIRSYATCVLNIQNDSEQILTKDSCAAEFQAVKDCFRSVRQITRQQQQ